LLFCYPSWDFAHGWFRKAWFEVCTLSSIVPHPAPVPFSGVPTLLDLICIVMLEEKAGVQVTTKVALPTAQCACPAAPAADQAMLAGCAFLVFRQECI